MAALAGLGALVIPAVSAVLVQDRSRRFAPELDRWSPPRLLLQEKRWSKIVFGSYASLHLSVLTTTTTVMAASGDRYKPPICSSDHGSRLFCDCLVEIQISIKF